MTPALDEQSVTPGDANAQLSRILASPGFATAHQMATFLRYIVSESLAGRSESLKERTVAHGALGRELRFDPRLDCIVRVVAGKVRRALSHYYASQGASDAVLIDVPKGSYCPLIRHRPEASNGHSASPHDAPHGNTIPASISPRRVVAVVPLKLYTVGSRERLLADILADDIVVRLGRSRGLEVIDCLASGTTRAAREDLRASAARLHAEYVFGGTISRVGTCVRLTARLIDGQSGALLWGDQFDRELDQGPLAQQDDLADSIVSGICGYFGLA